MRVRASQVGLTCRPLRNDEKCGKGEDANLAARHAGAAIARSGGVVSHSGLKSSTLGCDECASLQSVVLVLSGWESVQLRQPALLREPPSQRHWRTVKAIVPVEVTVPERSDPFKFRFSLKIYLK